MGLNDIHLKLSYRGDVDSVIEDFYIPCLSKSTKYDRAVGYFNSHSFSCVAKGLSAFIRGEGLIRVIASPNLLLEDIQAIETGLISREDALCKRFEIELSNLEEQIIENRLGVLSWLIGADKLCLKIAFCKELRKCGIYHEKLGIFIDSENNKVVFTGSANETYGGLVANFENIDVFASFNNNDKIRVEDKIANFENMWNNTTENLEVIDFGAAARDVMKNFVIETEPKFEYFNSSSQLSNLKIGESLTRYQQDLRIPQSLVLFKHQRTAINEWVKSGGNGILEMATGTGKTKTALCLATKIYEKCKPLAIIIICPYKHLVLQWASECNNFGIQPVLCFEKKAKWLEKLNSQVLEINAKASSYLCAICTIKAFLADDLSSIISKIRQNCLLIADEVHNLGSAEIFRHLPENMSFKVGLSATPERHFDEVGTEAILKYFGGIVFRYSLKDTIRDKILSKYEYFPHLVELTEDETDKYMKISKQIMFLIKKSETDSLLNEKINLLLIKRARLVAAAKNKIPLLLKLLKNDKFLSHILFYCGDGTVDDEATEYEIRQIDFLIKKLGNELNIRVHPFTCKESSAVRERIKSQFENETLQALAAIRCLDEGVDIPSVKTAYILASSSNPRQFIQRRGRLLRKHKSKRIATIHDFIVVPPFSLKYDEQEFHYQRGLVKKELKRIVEFSESSENEGFTMDEIREIKVRYNLLDM